MKIVFLARWDKHFWWSHREVPPKRLFLQVHQPRLTKYQVRDFILHRYLLSYHHHHQLKLLAIIILRLITIMIKILLPSILIMMKYMKIVPALIKHTITLTIPKYLLHRLLFHRHHHQVYISIIKIKIPPLIFYHPHHIQNDRSNNIYDLHCTSNNANNGD